MILLCWYILDENDLFNGMIKWIIIFNYDEPIKIYNKL